MLVLSLQGDLASNPLAAVIFAVFLAAPVAAGLFCGIKWRWLKATIIALSMSVILHELALAALSLWVASCPACKYASSHGWEVGDRQDQFGPQVFLLTLAAIYWVITSTLSAAVGRAVARRRSRSG
jgi:hypothetical protein